MTVLKKQHKDVDSNVAEATHDTCSLCVILFCHNQEHYLGGHVEVLRQSTNVVDQLIIVDVASGHPIKNTVDRLFCQWRSLDFVRFDENIGIVNAVNNVLGQVKTDFVHFLAADDSVEPEFYSSFRDLAASSPRAGVYSSSYSTLPRDGGTKQPFRLVQPARERIFLAPDRVRSRLLRHDSWFAGHATIFNVVHLKAAGGFDPTLHGFTDAYAILVLSFSHGALFEPRHLAVKRQHSDQESLLLYSAEDTLDLLGRVLDKMRFGDHKSLFNMKFLARFEGRWRYNVAVSRAHQKFGLTNSKILFVVVRMINLIWHKPFDVFTVAYKNLWRA